MKITDLPGEVAAEAASAYQAARGSRQIMYGLTKKDERFRDLYDKTQALYLEVCERFEVPAEPVFDEDEYKKSDRYKAIMEGRIR
jgi:hypothetical protein